MTALKVKCYYQNAIRRFQLDHQSEKPYHELIARLRQTFALKVAQKFSVKFKDDEGEDVTLYSDDSLKEAFDIVRSRKGILKLYVKLEKDSFAMFGEFVCVCVCVCGTRK